MTDDESRNAFAEWSSQYYGYEHAYPADADAWQAAVEWATKRERERCAKIVKNNGAFWNLATDHEDWARIVLADICQKEPKP